MIIRITLESHKFTQIIEKYFDDGGCFAATNYSSAEDYKEFMKNVESYNRYSMSPQRTKLKEKLEEDIKQNFINYINNINSNWKTELFDYQKIIPYKDIIFRNIDVSLRDLIFDRSWNRKVVFYFCSINKYLIL